MSHETTQRHETSHARIPWLASSMSMCWPGLGQIYCGRVGRGLIQLGLFGLFGPSMGTFLIATMIPSLVLFGGCLWGVLVIVAYWSAVDAKRIAKSPECQDYSLRDYNRPAVYVFLMLPSIPYALMLAFLLRASVLEAFVIPTSSMAPTLIPGDRILTNKLGISTRTIHRGDVIVFRNPENRRQTFVKRIVGLPGDTVEVTERELLINGEVQHRLSESATPNQPPKVSKQTVPTGSYFVMGDNRDLSRDSRNFGFLSHGEITGVVTYLYWPSKSWSRFGAVK
ncbi:MAG: signal peptidase I [Planctomycetaceae bacterium]